MEDVISGLGEIDMYMFKDRGALLMLVISTIALYIIYFQRHFCKAQLAAKVLLSWNLTGVWSSLGRYGLMAGHPRACNTNRVREKYAVTSRFRCYTLINCS